MRRMTAVPRRTRHLRVGAHTSIAGGLYRALEQGAAIGCDVIQIFVRSNQQWALRSLDAQQIELWHETRQRTSVQPAMAHGSYLINLSAREKKLRARSYRVLALEYKHCGVLGIPYYVIHPGSHMGQGETLALRQIAATLEQLFNAQPDNRTVLLLENTAGQGTSIGHRFEHLRDLFAWVRQHDRLGVCIDTCHTLAAGYDIRSGPGWNKTFEAFNRIVGCRYICAFHVNDSKAPRASRVDRHEHIGRGHVGLAGFRCLVNDPRFVGLPMVLETPKPTVDADRINLEMLRALHGRQRVGMQAVRLRAQPL